MSTEPPRLPHIDTSFVPGFLISSFDHARKYTNQVIVDTCPKPECPKVGGGYILDVHRSLAMYPTDPLFPVPIAR